MAHDLAVGAPREDLGSHERADHVLAARARRWGVARE
jgi:hypothetical protein